jgi:CRISPR-associated protein Csd1
MMLGALVEYAKLKGLVAEPGFSAKEIKWLAAVSLDGRFTGVVPQGDNKKGKGFARCPDLQQPDMMTLPKRLGVPRAAYFLWDTCGAVSLLMSSDAKKHKENIEKHISFKHILSLSVEELPELLPLHLAFSSPKEVEFLRTELERQKAKPLDKISFIISERIVLNESFWHSWWRVFYGNIRTASPKRKVVVGEMLDLSNGMITKPANTHPKITKIGKDNRPLITFDKDAYTSFGLKQGQNGAVSHDTSAAYSAAIDLMLTDAKLLGEMKIALWYENEIPPKDDFFYALFDPNPEGAEQDALERAKTVLNAIRTGEKPRSLANSRFNAIAMSGAAGRVMVRDWQTGSLEEFVTAIEAWFTDLSITNARGSRIANPAGLNRLLMSLQRPKDPKSKTTIDDYVKPIKNLQIPLWRAALNPNVPIPLTAIIRIMESHRSDIMTGKFDESLKAQKGDVASLGRIYARMGLLKAYHNRKGDYTMTPALDPNHPSKAYHCGRLMCLLALVQEKALGDDINAGIVQRYYGAASSTPALVLGRLTRLSQHHIAKISRDTRGLGIWLNTQLAEVWNALGKDLPSTLTLEEQSLFALGYYQQFAFNRTKRSGNPEAEPETPTQEQEGA